MVWRRSRVSLGPKPQCCLPFSFSLTSLFLPTSVPTLQVLFPLVAISSSRSFPTLSLLPYRGEAHASGCMHLGHRRCVRVCLCAWHVWNMLLRPACVCVTCMSVHVLIGSWCVCVCVCVCVCGLPAEVHRDPWTLPYTGGTSEWRWWPLEDLSLGCMLPLLQALNTIPSPCQGFTMREAGRIPSRSLLACPVPPPGGSCLRRSPNVSFYI